MEAKKVLTKLQVSLAEKRTKLLTDARKYSRSKCDWKRERAESFKQIASRLNVRTFSGLTYKMRDNYFANARGTCGLNPETMTGHSYSWYRLVDKINGTVILNDYRYSQQTAIHIARVSRVLDDLGVSYKTLRAPAGLQDLKRALDFELSSMATSLVHQKYSRGEKRSAKYFVNRMLKFQTPQLKLLAKLGYKAARKMRMKALAAAELHRLDRNSRIREKSALRRAAEKIEIVSDYANKLHGAVGMHVIKTSDWAWSDDKTIRDEKRRCGRSTFQWERERAVREGFQKIYVHSKEPRHLSVVGGA